MTGHHIPVECEYTDPKTRAKSIFTTYKSCSTGNEGMSFFGFQVIPAPPLSRLLSVLSHMQVWNVMVLIACYYFVVKRRASWLQDTLEQRQINSKVRLKSCYNLHSDECSLFL